jgi:hypothetical protein
LFNRSACGIVWRPFQFEAVRRLIRVGHKASKERWALQEKILSRRDYSSGQPSSARISEIRARHLTGAHAREDGASNQVRLGPKAPGNPSRRCGPCGPDTGANLLREKPFGRGDFYLAPRISIRLPTLYLFTVIIR